MRVYQVTNDEQYGGEPNYRPQVVLLPEDAGKLSAATFKAVQRPMSQSWIPLRVAPYLDVLRLRGYEPEYITAVSEKPVADLWLLENALVMSQKSRERLYDYLKGYGEFLPLASETGEYSVFHVTATSDGLDPTDSEIDWLSGGEGARAAQVLVFGLRRCPRPSKGRG